MATSCVLVLTMSIPSTIAGVAMQVSPIVFVVSSLNWGPAWTTKTSPSSLVK